LPVPTSWWSGRGAGAPVRGVDGHASSAGSYLPPLLWNGDGPCPPHTIMREPVHTELCFHLGEGDGPWLVGVQESETGSYRPPELSRGPSPPHTIIRLPVHTAVWFWRGHGALTWDVGVHESVAGS